MSSIPPDSNDDPNDERSDEPGDESLKTADERENAKEPSSEVPTEASAKARPEDKLEKAEQTNRDLHDRLLRMAAEFENWKKRAKKEQEEAQARGREGLLKELLPTLDNLERALKHAPENDPLATGVRLVEKQLLGSLEKFQVTRFSAVGKPFDPSMHDAIQQVETSEHPPGVVAQEFASGYMQGPRLLRAAMVAVAKAPAGVASHGDGGGNGAGGGETGDGA